MSTTYGRAVPLAHSFGERYDLPIPLVLFVLGGAATVIASFLLVLRRPSGTGDSAPDEPALRRVPAVTGWLSVAVTAALAYVGFTGTQEVSENLLPVTFWLVVWVAVPLTVGLVGDWTRPVNPFSFLSQLTDSAGVRRALLARRDPLPWRLGWWPPAALLLLLACGELVVPLTATLPRVVATGLVVYALLCLALGLLFGPGWRGRGEVFSVLFETWGRLGFFRFGATGRRGFAGGLRGPFAPEAGRAAFVLLLLVTVNVDGLLATPFWADVERPRLGHLGLLRLAAVVVVALLVAAVFTGFATASTRAGQMGLRPLPSLAALLPSMVPIAYAYLLAHNLQYLLVNGQLLPTLLGNPTGEHLLGLPAPFDGSYLPDPTFLASAVYWYAGVTAIVGAHVVAVVLAHRQLHVRRAEYPWLVAMVAYTMASLVLIAQPLVAESPASSAGTVSQSSNTD
jgi:hypothetical protein